MNVRKLLMLMAIALLFCGLFPFRAAEAQSGNIWRADFFTDPNWSSGPVFSSSTYYVGYNWGYGSPAPSVPADYFSARFTTNAFFYAGTYRFSVLADDEFVLIIDGVTYLDTRGQGLSGKTMTIDLPMWQGTHYVEVDYREATLTAYVYVTWAYLKPSDGGQPPPPPPEPLPYPTPPASASSVVTPFGDYTPCIQNQAHQANCFQSNGQWDSPNLESIQTEPQITIWGNCEPADSDVIWTIDPTTDPVTTQRYRCSKTLAGWFPA